MTLQRIGASFILQSMRSHLTGSLLELGVGNDPYGGGDSVRVTVDIEISHRPDVVADAHALPFRDGSFDSALASQVFEHLRTPSKAASELSRVHSGAGAVVIAVPFLFGLHQEPVDYQRFTAWGLHELLDPHFSVARIVPYGGRFASAFDILVRPTRSSSIPRRAIRRLRKRLLPQNAARAYRRVGSWLLRRPAEHPLGYVVMLTTRQPGQAS